MNGRYSGWIEFDKVVLVVNGMTRTKDSSFWCDLLPSPMDMLGNRTVSLRVYNEAIEAGIPVTTNTSSRFKLVLMLMCEVGYTTNRTIEFSDIYMDEKLPVECTRESLSWQVC